jgi:hypothetical protein
VTRLAGRPSFDPSLSDVTWSDLASRDGPRLWGVRVAFYKQGTNGRRLAAWEATRGARTRVPGTVMAEGKSIPHDLAQYVIEAATGYRNGFWDLVAQGATFKSTGRRRTKPGRRVIAEHRTERAGAEQLAGLHMAHWQAQRPSPVTDALNRALAQWRGLSSHQRLTFEWPSALGQVSEWTFDDPNSPVRHRSARREAGARA